MPKASNRAYPIITRPPLESLPGFHPMVDPALATDEEIRALFGSPERVIRELVLATQGCLQSATVANAAVPDTNERPQHKVERSRKPTGGAT